MINRGYINIIIFTFGTVFFFSQVFTQLTTLQMLIDLKVNAKDDINPSIVANIIKIFLILLFPIIAGIIGSIYAIRKTIRFRMLSFIGLVEFILTLFLPIMPLIYLIFY